MAVTLLVATSGCGDDDGVALPDAGSDAGGRDAGAGVDAASADADTSRDAGAVRIDAGTRDGDAGIVDVGTACDPATYYERCDTDTSRIRRCLPASASSDTVHAVPCATGQRCLSHASGAGACVDSDLGLCDSTFVTRCDGTDTMIQCFLFTTPDGSIAGGEQRQRCGAGEECRATPGGTGVSCVPAGSEPCNPATYVPACGTDHQYRDCVDGAVRVSTGCAAGYVCATISGSTYTCVDGSLTACDPATFVDACEHGPDAAVVCDPVGFVTHERCGTTNPLCVVTAEGHAGCSYAGAPACPAGGYHMCDSAAPEYLQVCSSRGIPRRRRCIASPAAPSCACRTAEIAPMTFSTDCYTTASEPCASTDA